MQRVELNYFHLDDTTSETVDFPRESTGQGQLMTTQCGFTSFILMLATCTQNRLPTPIWRTRPAKFHSSRNTWIHTHFLVPWHDYCHFASKIPFSQYQVYILCHAYFADAIVVSSQSMHVSVAYSSCLHQQATKKLKVGPAVDAPVTKERRQK